MRAAVVIDASAALAWVLPGEGDAEGDALLDHVEERGAVAPALWRIEVANILLGAERQRRIQPGERTTRLAFLAALPIAANPETSDKAWTETVLLAERHGLTVYDACYLELALRLRLPLATRDRDLKRAADRVGLPSPA